MRYFSIIVPFLLLTATSCGRSDEFVINAEVEGLGEKGVEMIWTAPQGLRKASFHPTGGKMELHGSSDEPTLVDVFTIDGDRLFSCIAADGDELSVKLDPTTPGKLEIKGNEASEEYTAFLRDNAALIKEGDSKAINAAVSDVVRSRPDRLSSAAILATCFDARGSEMLADSLIDLVSKVEGMTRVTASFSNLVRTQVAQSSRDNLRPLILRTARDTTARFSPSGQSYSLLVFNGGVKDVKLRSLLRTLHADYPEKRIAVLEISLTGDSATWATSIKPDSAKWMQAWLPGGPANPMIKGLKVPALPFFIAADSLGRLLYRGTSAETAADTIRKRLTAQ